MAPKDLFSGHAKVYATFRPTYPQAFYDFIFQHVNTTGVAWDCATGNGQVAQHLAKHFKEVHATDISEQQLSNAVRQENIIYSKCPAEKTPFADQNFDLITVGQALHWFNRNDFYKEVARTLKPNGVVAVWGYALLSVDDTIDRHFLRFYNEEIGPYWDEARRLVEEEYKTIDFPFKEIEAPRFAIEVSWNLDQFGGYLSSWSATQKFIKANNHDPVPEFLKSLRPFWKIDDVKKVTFPVFLRLGKLT